MAQAQQEELVWNKTLLVVSVLLGLLAAGLFYAYDWRMRKKLTGDVVTVLRWKRSLRRGDLVALSDIEEVTLRKQIAGELRGVITRRDRTLLEGGNVHLARDVRKYDFVLLNDILGAPLDSPSRDLGEGMRAVTLRVDPNMTPGDMLRVNDRVDVVSLVSFPGRPLRSYVILENVRVKGIGGRSANPEDQPAGAARARGYRPSMRTYRSITVEVKRKTVQQLAQLLPRLRGKLIVALRPLPKGELGAEAGGELNPELLPLLKQPLPEDLPTGG